VNVFGEILTAESQERGDYAEGEFQISALAVLAAGDEKH
jgi:hypothetical protein